MSISAENLVWSVGKTNIVNGVTLAAQPGKVLGLLGPNGSGKSSLLRLLSGLRRPASGRVLLEGRNIQSIGRRALARRMALVEQHATTEANVRVRDVVSLGRIPHRSPFSGWTVQDQAAVDAALDRVGMLDRTDRYWHSLSGGERQRVHLARALAQAPRELLLDEPTNHLDIQHQMALLKLVGELSLTTIVALHDINHAAMFCDQLMVLDGGKLVAQGGPEEVLSEALMREVFCVEARIESSPHHGRPHIHYLV
ncbi:ABC transporter ATP-binding protein [Aminobacter aminovorans]|uniref:Iron complex transport system ATP-binding protein n=1 Tax=Aminobacter aminovorans TaxID=83263 RepID=A0AAC9ATW0_AMIAI|nr:ABC transporter ATP-binding protein [Aminobacter aminovorans]AMS45106.1 Iron(III) dicitrate transport ATP-binding protein [Aminobacter aminovorans]MBB3705139.1 iron complex transport system ATP-binding protein [Aminobacter aminovorans]